MLSLFFSDHNTRKASESGELLNGLLSCAGFVSGSATPPGKVGDISPSTAGDLATATSRKRKHTMNGSQAKVRKEFDQTQQGQTYRQVCLCDVSWFVPDLTIVPFSLKAKIAERDTSLESPKAKIVSF